MSRFRSASLFSAACLVLAAQLPASAQTQTPIQLFGSTLVRLSATVTSAGNPTIFNSSNVNLTCAAPIKAVLSSTRDGLGKVLLDNYVQISVTNAAGVKSTPVNVCTSPTSQGGQNGSAVSCFNFAYQSAATGFIGNNMDTFAPTGGIPPIDVSSFLVPGTQQATIELVDTGYYLTNASLYLVTNCTQGGVTGPATVTGNPIPATNPPPDKLKQDFDFNPSTGQSVGFTYDISTSQQNGQLTITDNTIPNATDMPLDPALWQSQYATGTSFATSSCIVHRGEILNGHSACKLYTLTCQVGTGLASTGAQCPVSQLRDEIFADRFTGPSFGLPDITGTNGKTFHQGVGLLMASEGWTGGNCIFDTASGLQSNDCPQNLLTFFSSPGVVAPTPLASTSTSGLTARSRLIAPQGLSAKIDLGLGDGGDEELDINGTGTHPNSTFISVSGVPEDLTTVTVTGAHSTWVNSHTVKAALSSEPPVLPNTVPNYLNFHASPIQTITYGLAPASAVLSTKFAIPGDTTLTNTVGCPSPATPGTPIASIFAPPTQTLSIPTDGQYSLHYFAQDCAGTEELKFTSVGTGGWATSFYTVPINVDTVAPVVSAGPVLSPAPITIKTTPNAYAVGQKVYANYTCTDNASGLASCGASTWSAAGTLSSGALSSLVDTSTPGTKSFTVTPTDIAGNTGTPVTVTYTVVKESAELVLLQAAPDTVQTGTRITYDLLALNFGPDVAPDVIITDTLPAGTTFVSAGYETVFCALFGGCSTPAQAPTCTVSGSTLTCKPGALKALAWNNIVGFGVKITLNVTAPVRTVLTNTATALSGASDPDLSDNTSTQKTTVRR